MARQLCKKEVEGGNEWLDDDDGDDGQGLEQLGHVVHSGLRCLAEKEKGKQSCKLVLC